ncbi:MAG: zinc-ribbon and DUF3426 domain-containing protein [Gammaproteobacteria bacterium]|nr:zinc-ribbon and DUF3426 domain-containing protein [Gammaproteobacteria bacterium]NND38299.1 DUF3426 domain-containing protein [Pseudomonadales bacterium]
MITECPHCKTRFLVMENLFKSADGNARCGACMKTFKVFDHLKDYGNNAGGLLINPEIARKKIASTEIQDPSLQSTLAQRQRGDGRIEPVVLGADQAVDSAQYIDQLQPDPIDMQRRQPQLAGRIANLIPTTCGLVLALLMAGLMLLQWFEISAADLPDNKLLRGAHHYACQLVRCEAAGKQYIVARQLIVYSHPERDDALLVETVIVNLAKRAKPFPRLKLEFHNIDGEAVASRVFKPEDYLAGELAGKRDMPPQTPIQLELPIVDPGAHAVNYALDILPAI